MGNTVKDVKKAVLSQINAWKYSFKNRKEPAFDCPICNYHGPLKTVLYSIGWRKFSTCPYCGASERHRLQALVFYKLAAQRKFKKIRMLHIAPEPFFRKFFESQVAVYETADLVAEKVDLRLDLQDLPFKNESYDFIFASHVLEHVPDDNRALAEIRRVLTEHGIAILPVPVIVEQTVEYPEPNPYESGHVRAPGTDYFDRYRRYFAQVVLLDSTQVSESYQTFLYEDRSAWPNSMSPLRTPMQGERHPDVVPVCYVQEYIKQ